MQTNPETQFPARPQAPAVLLVFARYPELGAVKSRIAKETGEASAFDLYRAMLDDLLENIGTEDDDLIIEILWTAEEPPAPGKLGEVFGRRRLVRQEGRDLGERLATAFNERAYFRRCPKILAIGTDLPSLSRADIDQAILLLDSCDWILGPASDGGYYLIGCRSDAYMPTLFNGVAWGTSSVLETTEARIREQGHTIAMLPERNDLDLVDDLESAIDRDAAPRTSRVWASLREAAR